MKNRDLEEMLERYFGCDSSYYRNQEVEGVNRAIKIGYKFAQKQIKQQILDLKNKYKSHLQEETNCKIGKNINFVRETELKAKISTLIELENKLGL